MVRLYTAECWPGVTEAKLRDGGDFLTLPDFIPPNAGTSQLQVAP